MSMLFMVKVKIFFLLKKVLELILLTLEPKAVIKSLDIW